MTTLAENVEVVVFGSNLKKQIGVPTSMRVLDRGEDIPVSCPLVFRIIDQKDGDKRIVWDSDSWDEIRDAKDMFDQLIEEGMIPYVVDPSGQRTPQVMTEFDPLAEEIVLIEKEEEKPAPRKEVVFAPGRALAGG